MHRSGYEKLCRIVFAQLFDKKLVFWLKDGSLVDFEGWDKFGA
jgi:hypothetical protein